MNFEVNNLSTSLAKKYEELAEYQRKFEELNKGYDEKERPYDWVK